MKRLIASTLATLGLAVLSPVAVLAYGGPQTSAGACGGKPVVNVNFTLVNDFDSGVGIPQGWANDTINRHLQVNSLGGDMYCATVSDEGSFVTFAGSGPAGTGTLSADVVGRMGGGYRTGSFSGSLADTAYATHGNLGTFDLQCSDAYTCPGAHPSVGSYVSGWGGDLAWWGWEYKTPQNGTWTNAVDVPGTSVGNITD